MNCTNLMPARIQSAQNRATRIRVWAVVNAVVLLASAGVFATASLMLGGSGGPAAPEFGTAARDLARANGEMAQLRPQLTMLRAEITSGRSLTDQPDFSRLLGLISQTADEQVVLNRLQLEESEGRAKAEQKAADNRGLLLRLEGFGKSQAAVAGFALRLETSGVFDRVSLLQTHRQPMLGADATAFRIECAIQGPGGKTP